MVDASNSGAPVPDYKSFRTISTVSSCSMLACNLTSKDGTSFITLKNTDKGGQVSLYGSQVVSQEEDSVEPTISQISHKSDVLRAQYLKVQGQWFVVVCHLACCMIYNSNFTRKLYSYDIQ